jgi:dihydroorotate dehydrogenase
MPRLIEDLHSYLEKEGLQSVDDIVGAAHH